MNLDGEEIRDALRVDGKEYGNKKIILNNVTTKNDFSVLHAHDVWFKNASISTVQHELTVVLASDC